LNWYHSGLLLHLNTVTIKGKKRTKEYNKHDDDKDDQLSICHFGDNKKLTITLIGNNLKNNLNVIFEKIAQKAICTTATDG